MDMDIDDDYKKVQLRSLMKCLKRMIRLLDIMKKRSYKFGDDKRR